MEASVVESCRRRSRSVQFSIIREETEKERELTWTCVFFIVYLLLLLLLLLLLFVWFFFFYFFYQSCTRLQCHFIQSHIGRVYVCLAVTCHLHFWQNDRDLWRATARGWNGYRNKSQHRRLTLEKKILPPLLPGLEPGTFRSRVRRAKHWAIPAPRAE